MIPTQPTDPESPLPARLLRMPLYFKLIIANGAITLAAALACAGLVARAVRTNPSATTLEVVWPVVLLAVGVGVIVNAVVVRLALTPLRQLGIAAEAIRGGSETARAEHSPLSDAEVHRLIATFNSMLDSVGTYRQRLREIAGRALDAGEAERKRLSRDLHDGVAQSLAAVLVQLRVARLGADAGTAAALAPVAEELSSVINELRTMAQSLRPPALDMIGLSAAIHAHARNVSESTGVRVETRIEEIDRALEPEAQLALYRLVQEALLNVVRHGMTDRAEIDIMRKSDSIVALISDEGRGFDTEEALAAGALGLFGMQERALYIGGSVTVRSEIGAGTTVRIEIPRKDSRQWLIRSVS